MGNNILILFQQGYDIVKIGLIKKVYPAFLLVDIGLKKTDIPKEGGWLKKEFDLRLSYIDYYVGNSHNPYWLMEGRLVHRNPINNELIISNLSIFQDFDLIGNTFYWTIKECHDNIIFDNDTKTLSLSII